MKSREIITHTETGGWSCGCPPPRPHCQGSELDVRQNHIPFYLQPVDFLEVVETVVVVEEGLPVGKDLEPLVPTPDGKLHGGKREVELEVASNFQYFYFNIPNCNNFIL